MRSLSSFIYWTFRPLIKVILRYITKLCELQRICYSTLPGSLRTSQVEFSLKHSKRPEIKKMINYLDLLCDEGRFNGANIRPALSQSILLVISCKKINHNIHVQFVKSFSRCVELIWGYNQLVKEIIMQSKTQYDSENNEHEEKLIKLWNLLRPDVPLENRISKQWQDIGFQGDDPKTDFRGMGILGLDNLLFFAQEYPNIVSNVLSHSMHPTLGYEFAIVGINLTNMTYQLLLDGSAKTHIYNVCHSLPKINIFHHLYCYLFYEFDKYWIKSKPTSIMDFIFIKQKFEYDIRQELQKSTTIFKIKTSTEVI